jgi:hypothetical protein
MISRSPKFTASLLCLGGILLHRACHLILSWSNFSFSLMIDWWTSTSRPHFLSIFVVAMPHSVSGSEETFNKRLVIWSKTDLAEVRRNNWQSRGKIFATLGSLTCVLMLNKKPIKDSHVSVPRTLVLDKLAACVCVCVCVCVLFLSS